MLSIKAIQSLTDNYIWILERPPSPSVMIVDPGEAEPVDDLLSSRGLKPVAYLLTHHHGDHIGALEELLQRYPAPVYGPAQESIDEVDHSVCDGDRIVDADLDLELQVIDIPGHTAGHIAYLGPGFALVGDTLFAGGCGRVFEGTPKQMYSSLNRLAEMPPETEIYCAHEYTIGNLRFALQITPDSEALATRLQSARAARAQGEPTVPFTIGEELATNPFLRCTDSEIVTAAEIHSRRTLSPGAEVFAEIRGWKDKWRG